MNSAYIIYEIPKCLLLHKISSYKKTKVVTFNIICKIYDWKECWYFLFKPVHCFVTKKQNEEIMNLKYTWQPSLPLEKVHIIVGFKWLFSFELIHSLFVSIGRLAFIKTFEADLSTPRRPQPTIIPTLPPKSWSVNQFHKVTRT